MRKIAIQGTKGSFHDIAAHQFFEGEPIELICCKTFEQVFEAIQQDATVMGLVAIENTIAGSLLHNYELLRSSGVVVVGEHKLHIKHSICCLADVASFLTYIPNSKQSCQKIQLAVQKRLLYVTNTVGLPSVLTMQRSYMG